MISYMNLSILQNLHHSLINGNMIFLKEVKGGKFSSLGSQSPSLRRRQSGEPFCLWCPIVGSTSWQILNMHDQEVENKCSFWSGKKCEIDEKRSGHFFLLQSPLHMQISLKWKEVHIRQWVKWALLYHIFMTYLALPCMHFFLLHFAYFPLHLDLFPTSN